jgi:putative peptidoglycan lipid II flippase
VGGGGARPGRRCSGALAAPLLVRLVLGGAAACDGAVDTGTRMLLVFLPQVVLYGIGLVLAGVLQAHHRFLGPALAPLLSSLVVITAYLAYAAQDPSGRLAELTRTQELTLSVGTTLGVAVLSLGLLVPLRRAGIPLRPGLRFPPGVAARARGLAGAGVAALAAQQVALVVALRLAGGGDPGSVVVFTLATALFLLPWAVLAVPVATSAFPLLSARAAERDDADTPRWRSARCARCSCSRRGRPRCSRPSRSRSPPSCWPARRATEPAPLSSPGASRPSRPGWSGTGWPRC